MKLACAVVLCLATLTACGSTEAACEEEAYQCDGDMLQVCSDGDWVDDEDCAAVDMMCHAEMGHCMAMGSDTEDTDDTESHTGM